MIWRMPPIGRSIVLAIAIAAAPVANAQQSDVLQDFQNQSLDFPRGRGLVTVKERDQPLYDPRAYELGSIELLPRVDAETSYDSNIYAVRKATGDLVARLHPRVDATTTIGDAIFKVAGEADRKQYLGHPSQSTTDLALGSAIRYESSRDTSFYVGARLAKKTESRTDPDAPLNSQRPIRYDSVSTYVGGLHSFNRLRLAARFGAENRDYHNARDASGAVIDEHFRSRLLLTGDLAAEYGLTPDASLFIDGSVNKRDYGRASAIDPPRDSQGYRVTAGANFALTNLVRGQVGLGYFEQDFRSNAYPDPKGFAFKGKIEYLVTPLVTLTATANRGVEESSTPSVGAYVATQAGIGADYEFLRNLILSASVGYERDKFQGVDRRYTIGHAKLGAIYKLSPRVWLNADYDFRNQTSAGSFPGRAFARHQLMIGLTIQGM